MRTQRDAIDSIRYEWVGLPSADAREENPIALVHRRLRGRYVAATFLAVGLAAIGAAALWRAAPPEYVSRGLVQVDPTQPSMLTGETSPPPMFYQYVSDQATYVTSRPVLEEAVRSEHLAQVGWPQTAEGIARLEARVRAIRLQNQNIIDVSARHGDATIAAAMVNGVLDAYQDHVSEPSRRLLEQRRDFLEDRIDELETTLVAEQNRLASVTDGYGPDVLDRLHLRRAEALLILEQQHRAWQAGELDPSFVPGQGPADAIGPVAGATMRRAERLAALEGEELQLLARRDNLLDRFTDRHPIIREIDARLGEIRAALDLHRRAMDAGLPEPALAAAVPGIADGGVDDVATDALDGDIAALWSSRLAALRQEVADLGGRRDDARRIDAGIETLRERIVDTRGRLDAVEIEMTRANPSRISIAAQGEIPLAPARDRRTKLALVGALGGFGAGFAAIILLGIAEGRVRHAADLVAERDLPPVLASLPLVKNARRRTAAGRDVHRIRALLEANAGADGCGLHLVAAAGGSSEGAGSGDLAVAVANSFARAGRRTLLIDADLAEPGIGRTYGLEHAPGLRECLAGPESGGRVHHGGPGDLWILPTGGRAIGEDGSPAPLPSRRGLDELVAALRDRFDAIIVESGSVNTSAEALAMAGLADTATVVVARHARVSGVRSAIQQIGRAGGDCTGIVLTQADPSDVIDPPILLPRERRANGRGGGGALPYVDVEPAVGRGVAAGRWIEQTDQAVHAGYAGRAPVDPHEVARDVAGHVPSAARGMAVPITPGRPEPDPPAQGEGDGDDRGNPAIETHTLRRAA